jgi:hypothetical protein
VRREEIYVDMNVKTRREVRAVNTILGYAVPEIATPEEYVGGI